LRVVRHGADEVLVLQSAAGRSSAWACTTCADVCGVVASSLLSRSLSAGTNSGLCWRGWNTLSISWARSAGIRFSGTFWPQEM
jgi:hypothetical protein